MCMIYIHCHYVHIYTHLSHGVQSHKPHLSVGYLPKRNLLDNIHTCILLLGMVCPTHSLSLSPAGTTTSHTLVLALDSSGGYYTLGDPLLHQHMFTLSLTLQNPANLSHVCTCMLIRTLLYYTVALPPSHLCKVHWYCLHLQWPLTVKRAFLIYNWPQLKEIVLG